ncbi:MAG: DoxX family membrane protein [Candidatus Aminicenantes bacterium]|nr:DoxX family membrane protein [Candidatus Aminicenantes bacterium]
MLKNKTLLVVFRLVLGGLFIYAGVVKVLDPLDFAQNIRNYRLVGQSLSFIAAVVLPWLEILAGVALAAGIWKRASALIITGLLVFFILLTLVTIARGLDVECGCFGALSRKSGFGVVLEDLGMLFMGLVLLFSEGLSPKGTVPPN